MKRIILADNQAIFREGLSLLLEKNADLLVSAVASSANVLPELIQTHKPDLVIISDELTSQAKLEELKLEETKILLLSGSGKHVDKILKSEIDGLITRCAELDELLLALRRLFSGKNYMSPDLYEQALAKKEGSIVSKLTKREKEVLTLLASGHKNQKVAKMLHISARTIDSHRAHIMKKLDVRSTAEMIRIAIEEGLV